MSWWSATSVSITNNTKIVTVTTGDDISTVSVGSGLIIGSNAPVEIVRAYIDNSVKKLELKNNWTTGTVTAQAAVAFPTDADLNAIAVALSNYLSTFAIATQAQAEAGADNIASMTAARVKQAIDFQRKEATQVEAEAGTISGAFMSPLRVMQLIKTSGFLGSFISGSETDLNNIGSPRVTRLAYSSDSSLNRPTTDSRIYTVLQIAAQTNVCRQIAWCANTGVETMYMRTGNGSPTMVWTAWREIWHSGTMVKQTSTLDTTAGAMMTVGAFGLGLTGSNTQFSTLAISLDSTAVPSGMYRVVAADTGTKPAGTTDFTLLTIRYNGSDAHQIAISQQTGKMSFRVSGGGVWQAWKTVNDSLVAQVSPLDATAGSLLAVGAFGLGGGAINVADFTATELNVNRWGRFLSTAVSKPSFMNAGAFITAQYDGTPTTYLMGAGLKTDNTTMAAFIGKRNAPAAAPTWMELWDKTQAPVQATKQDMTANAVLQNGAFEIGSKYLQVQFALAITNGTWLAFSQYPGAQATLVNGWVYRVRLSAVATGVSTGTTYYVTQTAAGVWAVKQAGVYAQSGVNHPTLRVSAANNTLEVSHSGSTAQSIAVWCEGWYHGNVTILNPSWFGADPYIRKNATTGALEHDKLGTYRELWDTAAKPQQANRYDTTTNAMMQAGSFGWGTTAFGADGFGSNSAVTDANAITASGLYHMDPTWTGSPNAGTHGGNQGCLLHLTWTAAYAVQIFYRMQTHNADHQIRFKENGVWGSWAKFLTTDTLSAPAQTTIYDTTAGALLRPGAFGLGASSIGVVTTDANALRVSGEYRVGTAWTGSVFAGTVSGNQGTLKHVAWTGNYAVQTFYSMQSNTHYIRVLINNVWAAWTMLTNSDNAIGPVTYSGGINTGGILEYGTNANGVYYKHADGRLECHFSRSIAMTANTDDVYTWVFPATFISAPAYVTTNVTGASGSNGFKINKTTAASATTTQVTVRANVDYTQSHVLVYCAIGRWR